MSDAEVYAVQVRAAKDVVLALEDHPGVGVSGRTTEALEQARYWMLMAVQAIEDYPPVIVEDSYVEDLQAMVERMARRREQG